MKKTSESWSLKEAATVFRVITETFKAEKNTGLLTAEGVFRVNGSKTEQEKRMFINEVFYTEAIHISSSHRKVKKLSAADLTDAIKYILKNLKTSLTKTNDPRAALFIAELTNKDNKICFILSP